MNTRQLLRSAEWIWNLADKGASWDRLKEVGPPEDVQVAKFLEKQGLIYTPHTHWFVRCSTTGKQDVLSQWNEHRQRAGLKMGQAHMLAEFRKFATKTP